MSKKLVCAAVIRKEGMTLVCSRPKASILRDKMEFPGGKVEPGESIHECIVRELREELNAEILPLDVIGEVEHEYPAGILDIVFIRCVLKEGSIPVPCEGQEIRWVPTRELHTVDLLEADRDFAARIASGAE